MLTALRGLPLGFFFVVEEGFAFLVTAFFGLIALATFFTLATAVLAVDFTTDTTFLAFDTDDAFPYELGTYIEVSHAAIK